MIKEIQADIKKNKGKKFPTLVCCTTDLPNYNFSKKASEQRIKDNLC